VYAAGAGTVVFAGELAGRTLVSIAHPGGLRTSYEPVRPSVRVGQLIDAGAVIGELDAGHDGCAVAACLHWGAMWGAASRADYVDPFGPARQHAGPAQTVTPLTPLPRATAFARDTPTKSVQMGTLAAGQTRLPSKP